MSNLHTWLDLCPSQILIPGWSFRGPKSSLCDLPRLRPEGIRGDEIRHRSLGLRGREILSSFCQLANPKSKLKEKKYLFSERLWQFFLLFMVSIQKHTRSSWTDFNHGLVVHPQGCQGCQKIQKNILKINLFS